MIEITFEPPPTGAQFMMSGAFYRFILGPLGSGKTTTVLFEMLRRACEQHPGLDGKRRTRFALLRQTLNQLKQTVLKDIIQWFGPLCDWRVSESTIYFRFGDVVSEWILLPLETPEDQKRILSMNITGAFVSEAIEIDFDLMVAIAGRCGRFPSPADGGADWHGMVLDSNMPTEGTPWHACVATPPPEWEVFIQPGGLSPDAENLNYLLQTPETMKLPVDDPVRVAKGRTYYTRLSLSTNPAWVKRYVMAEFGPDPSGAAVYAGMFFVSFHCRDELTVIPGAPLLVGMDLGRDPWALLGQLDHMSRLLVHEEVPADDVGLSIILPALRRVVSQRRYLGCPVCIIFDPAGLSKGNFDERTSYDVLTSAGFMAIPAPSNRIQPRLNAVEKFLTETRGGTAGMLIDRGRCPTLVAGLNGSYRFKYNQILESSPVPEKNRWSHVCDAHQYLCQGASGGTATQVARKVMRMRSMADASVAGQLRGRRPTPAGWT
jgi:hypothetical protein